jgi:hypothetical protein
MKQADFTQPGGLPFDQDTLDFMQQSYYEVINALLSHFMVNTLQNYIISGCKPIGGTITPGWMIIAGELMYFEGGNGNSSTKIKAETQTTALTFQDGNSHDVYTFKKAVISTTGTALSAFIVIPNANEFLTDLPNATETLRGIAEIATQTETNGSTDNSRFVTPHKLHNRTATESRRGIAEVATQAETNAGVDDTRMVTPKKVVQAINDLAPQPPQATETVKGIAEIATQGEANGSTDDSRIITAKKLYNRTATTSRRGVVELATTSEVTVGTDSTRAVTPSSLKNAGIKPLRVTRGTVMTTNRAGGYNQNNYTVNRAYVYPPAGYSMSHLRGFIASIAEIHLAGDVDGNDSFWCKYQIQSSRVVVIANNSENRANSRINYLAIWQK